jgi:hypothetical protein
MNFRIKVARQKREIVKTYAVMAKIFPTAFRHGKPVVATLTPPAKGQS